jgi:ribose 5-phosphate isomerase B
MTKTPKPTIAIASDHGGFDLKSELISYFQENVTFIDEGCYSHDAVDYPDQALKVSTAIQENKAQLGIIICGTGIGISIAANKSKNIRAALCHNEYTAKMARQHNDANVLALGARVIGSELAKAIVSTFLANDFEGGRHQKRVEKINSIN